MTQAAPASTWRTLLLSLFILLSSQTAVLAQMDGSAWRTYFGVTYNTADSEAATRGIGPGYGLVGVANVAFGEGAVRPALSLGGAASYGAEEDGGKSGFLMVRPFVGAGANFYAVNSDQLKLVPRLLIGADAIGLYIDQTENGEGSLNVFLNPGVALRAGQLAIMADYRIPVGNLTTIVDEDSDYFPATLGEPTNLAPSTLTVGVAYRAIALHVSLWNRDVEFEDAITNVINGDIYKVNGFTVGLGIAIGN